MLTTAAPAGTHGCGLAESVQAWAGVTPDAPAVITESGHTSYAELEALTQRYMKELHHRGVREGAAVCMLMHRTVDWVAVELAVLRLGAACVPLDPQYPPARHRLMVEDTAPVLVIVGEGMRFPTDAAPTMRPGAWSRDVDALPLPPDARPGADGVAFVFYTSGSTGRPKGVLVRRGSVRNLLAAQREAMALTAEDRVSQAFSPSFDLSVWDLGLAFGAGAASVLFDSDDVHRILQERHVTVFSSSPTSLATLQPSGLTRLHTVVTGGEACPERVARRIAPHFRFVNAYGPTEATVISTTHVIDPNSCRPLIGRPLSRTSAYVLGPDLRAVDDGETGELYLGGAGVAHGYWRRSALTADRFLPDPFADEPGSRMYRTGDRARRVPGGDVDYLGRVDHQLKIRGLRIEPGEVQTAIDRHPAVAQSLVMGWGEAEDQRLIAYVAAVPGGHLRLDDLRARLAEELPAYMVPGAFVVLDAFPQNPNGKVDRAKLPPPGAGDRAALVPAGNAAEQTLIELWRDVLKVPVGREDNFFDLGGDSVAAALLVARAQREGIHLTVQHVFGTATLAELADRTMPLAKAPANGRQPRPAGGTAIDEETRRKLAMAMGRPL
ncbi:non-ribosomal peptide synthetase [Streptomyces sp. NPDC051940]|uniref:non-ribosomal peptide synthetase n=1 Tax=Streptomyces sp. NPDC051940 TaxID=3155675 RepID=UPI003445FF25